MRAQKIGIYIALLVMIVGGAPYFTGYLVETKFRDVIPVISDMGTVSVKLVKYQRGWWRSYAQTEVTLGDNYAAKLLDPIDKLTPAQKAALKKVGMTVVLDHEICHGPFVKGLTSSWMDWRFALAVFRSKVELSEDTRALIDQIFSQKKLLNIQGLISIDGAVRVQFENFPFTFKVGNVEIVDWKGASGEWDLSRDMKHFLGKLTFSGLTVQQEKTAISFSNFMIQYDEGITPEALWVGKISGTCELLAFKDLVNPVNNVELNNVQLGTSSDSQNGMVEGELSLSIATIKILDKVSGPLTMQFLAKKIDAQFLKDFLSFSRRVQGMSSQADQVKLAQKLVEKISDFLKNRPEVQMSDFSLKTAQGDVKAKCSFALGGENAHNMNNTMQIVQSISAHAEGILPKALLLEMLEQQYMQKVDPQPGMTADEVKKIGSDKAKDVIDAAVRDGYLVEQGDQYTAQWEFSAGQLKVNGKPMAFPLQSSSSPASSPASPNEGASTTIH